MARRIRRRRAARQLHNMLYAVLRNKLNIILPGQHVGDADPVLRVQKGKAAAVSWAHARVNPHQHKRCWKTRLNNYGIPGRNGLMMSEFLHSKVAVSASHAASPRQGFALFHFPYTVATRHPIQTQCVWVAYLCIANAIARATHCERVALYARPHIIGSRGLLRFSSGVEAPFASDVAIPFFKQGLLGALPCARVNWRDDVSSAGSCFASDRHDPRGR